MLQENMQISGLARAARVELEQKASYIVAKFAASLCVAALSVETGQLGSAEAGKYQAFALDNSGFVRLPTARPSAVAGKTIFIYTGENSGISTENAPSILDHDYTITAAVTIPEGGGEGMIATLGGRFGGYGLFLSQGSNWWLRSTPLKVEIWGLFLMGLLVAWLARNRRWTDWKTWPCYALILLTPIWLVAGLTVDGKEAGRKTIAHMMPLLRRIDETFDIGVDTRTAVDFSYDLPFRFNGTIDKLTYNLGPSQLTGEDQGNVDDAIAEAAN
jgi:hypothetical protein